MEKIAHAFGDVETRLLDHRPVIQGEVRYFVKEFEEKRGFRECRLLENLNKMVAETTEQALPKCMESMQENLYDTVTRSNPKLSKPMATVARKNSLSVMRKKSWEDQDSKRDPSFLGGLDDKLEAVNHMTQRIQQRELEALEKNHLQEGMERNRVDWEEFLKEQTRLKEEMDEKHAEAVGRLSAQYDEMKKDLSKLSHF